MGSDDWVILCSSENPLLGGECSFEKAARFSLQGWVVPSEQPTPTPLPEEGLIFIERRAATGYKQLLGGA